MRDFGRTRYCRRCGLEIVHEGEVVTISENSKFCECDKIQKAKYDLSEKKNNG